MDEQLPVAPTMPQAQEILDSIPVFAMVLDEHHRVLMSNSWFAENTGDPDDDSCPVACYERVHKSTRPHPDCPLVDSIRNGKKIVKAVNDTTLGQLTVTVVPFAGRFGDNRLFLHLTEMK